MLYVTVHASVRQQPQQMERGVVFLHMLYGFKESRILKEIFMQKEVPNLEDATS